MIAGSAVFAALLAGGSLGLVAAYYRGWTDRIVMRVMDVLFAFPIMLLAIGIIAMLGPGAGPTAVSIAIVYTPIFARLLRGPALVIATSDYVLSARSIGASDARIIFSHILPNLASVILVQTSLLLSSAILVEASLSFLGLGTQPPAPSLGMMLSEGRNVLLLSPWAAIFSGAAILIIAFVLNLLGDVLRDALDPRLRGAR
jgi:peptide/nickel transport system permease protein